jgi:hypothetical protein
MGLCSVFRAQLCVVGICRLTGVADGGLESFSFVKSILHDNYKEVLCISHHCMMGG